VVGTSGAGVERATTALVAAGHDVVTCHAVDESPFPCAALIQGRGCPLEHAPVDVVLDAHTRPSRMPSRYEDGAVCGLRRGVPLVVAGAPVHPYWRWVTLEVGHDDDIVAACETAARASSEQQAEVVMAVEAARVVLARAGVDPAGIAATVHRRDDRVHVLLELPPRPAGLHPAIVTEVVRALRGFDPRVGGVDVAIA